MIEACFALIHILSFLKLLIDNSNIEQSVSVPESSLREKCDERIGIEVEMVFVRKQWYSSKCQVFLQRLNKHICMLVVLDSRSLTRLSFSCLTAEKIYV